MRCTVVTLKKSLFIIIVFVQETFEASAENRSAKSLVFYARLLIHVS